GQRPRRRDRRARPAQRRSCRGGAVLAADGAATPRCRKRAATGRGLADGSARQQRGSSRSAAAARLMRAIAALLVVAVLVAGAAVPLPEAISPPYRSGRMPRS